MKRLHFRFIKFTRFEFWPFWFAYFPVYFYFLYLSIKAKSLTFFTIANPGFYLGGFVGESKKSILQKIHTDYLPNTIYAKADDDMQKIISLIDMHQMQFPLIVKPDVGERGINVEKVNNVAELESYIQQINEDYIIQSFIDFDIELGIMYYHFPEGTQSGISSIVLKEYLKICGDGVHDIEYLIKSHLRAQGRLDYLLHKFKERLQEVLANNEELLLEPIGNHIRGAKFLNGNHLINEKLVKVFDAIAKPIDGFYIGRFDLKVKSFEDLYEGKNIKIMELNGVTSEPAHIYDPSMHIVNAYKALFLHYKLIYLISQQNKNIGNTYDSFGMFYRELKTHLSK